MGKVKDKTGQRFGKLTVIKFTGQTDNNRHSLWECQCDCGNKTIVSSANLISGGTKSCGCLMPKIQPASYGRYYSDFPFSKTRIYRIWRDIKSRTTYKSKGINDCYKERDITMCDEWKNSSIAFFEWAISNGYKDNLTIDRIDNDKGYSPDNCRWATVKQQQNNQTKNVRIEFNGETKTISEWAEYLGINRNVLYSRLRNNWEIEDALTRPVRRKNS